MKSRKKLTILFVVFFLIFIGMYGIVIMMRPLDKQTLATTSEISATVTNVEITNTVETYVRIVTEEYGDALHVSPAVIKKIGADKIISSLQSGEVFTFRVENNKLQRFAELDYAEAVSIKTAEEEILSLDEYNEYVREGLLPPRIIGITITCISLLMSIYCLLRLQGIDVFRKIYRKK